MFEIKIVDTDVTGGSIPVSWCLDPDLAQVMFDQYGLNPQVVIVVAPVDGYHINKETRKVVPLRDLMTYMEFKAGGENKIWAFIISSDSNKNKYLSRERGRYDTDILSDGTEWGYSFHKTTLDTDGNEITTTAPRYGSVVDVNVPEQVFAKEPPEWEKVWVNHLFFTKCFDQCDFRRRRIFAYTVQPVIMLFQIVIRLFVTVIGLLIGSRDFSFKPLFHPLRYGMDDQFKIMFGGTIFVRQLDGYFPEPSQPFIDVLIFFAKKLCLLPFMPLILGILVLIAWLNPFLFAYVGLLIIATIFALVIVSLLARCVSLNSNRMARSLDSLVNFLRALFKEKEVTEQLNQEELAFLFCTPERKELTFKTLPSKKKTIRLHYMNLKNKVCKPFSA